MQPNSLGESRVPECKRFTVQTFPWSLEVVIQIILEHKNYLRGLTELNINWLFG